MATILKAPAFTHDCEPDCCTFYGCVVEDDGRKVDVYLHPGEAGGTVIARLSDDGADYHAMDLSMLAILPAERPGADKPLARAYRVIMAVKGLDAALA